MISRTRLAVLVVSSLAVAGAAEAGVQGIGCARPFVFSSASVNVVVLPYQGAADLGQSPELGNRLSRLIQAEVLRSIAKFGSVGAVQMQGSREDCEPDKVMAKLLGSVRGSSQRLSPGRGLVLLWGRFYSEAGDVFLQTFCRMVGRGSGRLDLTAEGQPLAGTISAHAFAFQPRRVTDADLGAFAKQFARSTILRSEPNEAAPARGRMDPYSSLDAVPYWIADTRDDWMLVDSLRGARGWIQLGGAGDEWSLSRWLPELKYVEGMVGYLRWRLAGRDTSGASLRWIASAERALMEYERTLDVEPGGSDAPLPAQSRVPLSSAVELQLRGIMRATAPAAKTADRAEALKLFERAAEILPYDANAVNLVLMNRLSLGFANGDPTFSAKDTADRLLRLLGTDPGNRYILANLESGYKAMLAQAGTQALIGDQRSEIAERLALIRRLSTPTSVK